MPDGTDGWSARLHWRTDGSGGSPTTRDTANVVQYVYHPDQPGTFGQDIRWDGGDDGQWAEFESDRWYTLEQRVVINTPGENDGIIEAWLDGEKVLEVSNLRFRDVDSFAIDQVLFSTFFGGSSDRLTAGSVRMSWTRCCSTLGRAPQRPPPISPRCPSPLRCCC